MTGHHQDTFPGLLRSMILAALLLEGDSITSHGPFARERTSALAHYSREQAREVWKRNAIEMLRFSSM